MTIRHFAAILLLSGCASQFFAGGEGTQRSAADGAKSSGKPSDESEGVPGYLTDPGKVQAVQAAGGVAVQAGKGEVAPAPGGSLAGLLVGIWTMSKDDYAQTSQGGGSSFGATLLGTAPVAGDGSFSSPPYQVSDGNVLIVNVMRQSTAPSLTVPPAGDGEFNAAVDADTGGSGVFSGLAPAAGAASSLDLTPANVPLLARGAIRDCLTSIYGPSVDVSKLGAYRALAVDALTYSGGTPLNDAGNGKPEIVHVTMNALAVSNLSVSLQSQAATYCLDIHALSFSASTIDVNCKAKYYDGSATLLQAGVQINKTGC